MDTKNVPDAAEPTTDGALALAEPNVEHVTREQRRSRRKRSA